MTSPADDRAGQEAAAQERYERENRPQAQWHHVPQWHELPQDTRDEWLRIETLCREAVRRRAPEPESECVRMYANVLRGRYAFNKADEDAAIAAFRAALAREVEAAYQRGREDEASDRI